MSRQQPTPTGWHFCGGGEGKVHGAYLVEGLVGCTHDCPWCSCRSAMLSHCSLSVLVQTPQLETAELCHGHGASRAARVLSLPIEEQ